jgi:phosphoglucomutase
VLAIGQAICQYRKQRGIEGPLFLRIDTHALSVSAAASALEVLCGQITDDGLTSQSRFAPE